MAKAPARLRSPSGQQRPCVHLVATLAPAASPLPHLPLPLTLLTASVSIHRVDTWLSSTLRTCCFTDVINEWGWRGISFFISLHLHLKRATLGCSAWRGRGWGMGVFNMGFYHGVFLDDSSGVAVVDVNRPAVVTLFGGAYGDIWVKKRTRCVCVNSQS